MTEVFAGFFFGTTILSLGGVAYLYQQNRKLDAERMRLWNRVCVRDGQTKIFTEVEKQAEAVPPTSVTLQTPFSRGLQTLRDKIASDKKGPSLPDNIRENIKRAANG